MDTTELEDAYRHLIEVARGESFRPPADTADWPAELRIAHVIATDRLLTATTALVLAGAPARYDNAATTEAAYLSEIGRAAGGHDALVATMRQCGLELVLVARLLDGEQAAKTVPTRIVEGDTTRVDAPLPWSAVLNTHAQVHLREHAAALQALR